MKDSTNLGKASKLGQAALIAVIVLGMLAIMVIETAAMYAGTVVILAGVAGLIYGVARGAGRRLPEPQRVRVIARKPEETNYRKAA